MNPIGLNILTHSRMQTFKTCARKHWYKYELGVRRDRESAPLRFGGAFHQGLDWLAQGWEFIEVDGRIRIAYQDSPEWIDEYDWFIERETVCVLLDAYRWYWHNDGAEILSTEETFNLPIRNPKTGKPSRTYRVSGKKDKVVRLADGRIALREHKTTSDSIAVDSDYWKKAELSHQTKLYFLATQMAGVDVEVIEYDVIRKPTMGPLRATPEDKRKYKKDGTLYANQREQDETPEEWGNRLLADIQARPDYYFRRWEFPCLRSEIDEFKQELWDQAKAIAQGWKFRNPDACIHPYRCEYLNICHDELDLDHLPEGFVRVDNLHPELEDDNANSNKQIADDQQGASREDSPVPCA